MPEIGEEIVGAYLKECCRCDFVEYNYDLESKQAECDVVGAAIRDNLMYFCEVATHTGGFLYVDPRTKKPANFERLVKKFTKDIEFARSRFPNFDHKFMFWSPIVKSSRPDAKYDSLAEVNKAKKQCEQELGAEIVLVINDVYAIKLEELRKAALKKGADSAFSILRFLQIEENLNKHLRKP